MKKAIFELLKRGTVDIELAYLTIGRWGECDNDEKLIVINKRLSDKNRVRTLIHECLHYLRKKWSEKKVLRYEEKIYASLTTKEFERLLKYLR